MNPLFSSAATKPVRAALIALVAIITGGMGAAQAQTNDPTGIAALIITTTDDTLANDGMISLREAIGTANSDGADSTITFALGGTIRLTSALPALGNNGTLSITGPPAGLTLSGDANNSGANDNGDVRLFVVDSGANVMLKGLTLQNGNGGVATSSDSYGSSGGGAIKNAGTLAVTLCSLTNNKSLNQGGAIYNTGTLAVESCTLTGNSALNGGAVDNQVGTMTLSSSLFKDNSAGFEGGAIRNYQGNLTVVNSTIFNSLCIPTGATTVVGSGGGIFNDGQLAVKSCTFMANRSHRGSTLYNKTAAAIFKNNLFIASLDSSPFYGFTQPTYLGDANKNYCFYYTDDAGVGDLADNGGPTQTMALQQNSHLINKAVDTDAPQFDQRGQARIQQGIMDVGSYESSFSNAPTDILLSNTTLADGAASGTLVGTLSNVDPELYDAHTYSLASGTGDEDNATFAVEGNQLKLTRAVSTATQSSYSIRLETRDLSGATFQKVFIISLSTASAAPTDIALSRDSVNENLAIGTPVGTLLTTDPNTGNSFTYSLVSGAGDTDNASFSIEGDVLKTTASFDFETKNSYSIRVQTRDGGGLTFQKALTVGVGNVYDQKPSLVVTTLADSFSDDDVTSLREAINAANSDGVNSAITFAVSGTIRLDSTLPSLIDNGTLTITGPQAGITISGDRNNDGRFDNNYDVRLFNVDVGANVTLKNLVMSGGVTAQTYGGAILNLGALTVSRCTLSGNSAPNGGAIGNGGILTVTESTLQNNFGSTTGGAIANVTDTEMTVTNSTFYDNVAGSEGGAISNLAGTATLINSTLILNRSRVAGAIKNQEFITLVNCTLASNAGPFGGATIVNQGEMTAKNCLFVGSSNSLTGFLNPTSSGDANKNFLIGTYASAGLSSLANNGGPTQTAALASTSQVVNAGLDTTGAPDNLTTDGRGTGFPRKLGGGVDVGAFEVQINTAPVNAMMATAAVAQGGTLVFSSTNNNSVSFSDANSIDTQVVVLTSLNGRLQLGGNTNGVTVTGDGTAKVTLSGSQTNLNAALDGLIFIPVTGYSGTNAKITMLTTDSGAPALSDSDTMTLTVTKVNRAPVAVADNAGVLQGGTVVVRALQNDSDADGDTLSISAVTQGTRGTVAINGDGTLTYSSNAGSGSDSFTYTLSDGVATATGTVSVTITGAGSISDVSSSVTVTRYGIAANASTRRFVQQVLLQNRTGTAITTPLFLVLDNLSAGAALYNKSGNVSNTPPVGSPYLTIPTGLAPGESKVVNLEFTRTGTVAISYATRLLTGTGTP